MNAESAPVGVIGLGSMGGGMAGVLLRSGFDVVGYDVDEERLSAVEGAGVAGVGSVAEVAAACPTLLVSVPATEHLEAVAEAIVAAEVEPRLVIDTSTVDPVGAAAIGERLEREGHSVLRAPVSGSKGLAASGGLIAFCSGSATDYAHATPVLDAISATHRLIGEGDAARVAKLVVNLIVIGTLGLLGEAVDLGERLGLSRAESMAAINSSVVASSFTAVKTDAIVEHDFSPTGTVDLVRKDMGLMLAAAANLQIALPVLASVDAQFAALQELGRGGEDVAVISDLPRSTIHR